MSAHNSNTGDYQQILVSMQTQGTITAEDLDIGLQVEAFLKSRNAGGLSRGTLAFYTKKLKVFLRFCEARALTRIDQITPGEIRDYIFWLQEGGHNPGGLHTYFRTLRAFLNWWENEYEPQGWRNPIHKIKAPKVPEEPLDPASTEDVLTLVNACRGHSYYDARDKAILQVLLDSGVRAQELCDLRLADVDLRSGEVTVRQGKGNKFRTTFIGDKAKKAVRHWLKKRRGSNPGALFTTREGTRLSYWGLRGIIQTRSKQSGIVPPSLHDFRRAFCLGLLQSGVPETVIARYMGHSGIALIARYAKQSKRDLAESYRSLLDDAR